MEIKGTAVKSIYDFVAKKHPEKFDEWFDRLPEKSKIIIENPILATDWYDLETAANIPTKIAGEIIFGNALKGARASGRYSAEAALKGIYKVFIKFSTPVYIINRASKIFSTYYRPSEMIAVDKREKGVTLHITKFAEPSQIIEERVAGWIECALEMNNCKNLKVVITKSLCSGNKLTEIVANWT